MNTQKIRTLKQETPLEVFNRYCAQREITKPGEPERFATWLHENPKAYDAWVAEARRLLQEGYRIRGPLITELVRSNKNLKTQGQFKINNNWTPYLSRLAMVQEDDLRYQIEVRDESGQIELDEE